MALLSRNFPCRLRTAREQAPSYDAHSALVEALADPADTDGKAPVDLMATGGYREGVAETLRRHGRAHLCMHTDADGFAWDFMVADRAVDLAPMIAQAFSTGEEVSVRSLEEAVLN